jgi:hypothetical protein
MSLVTGDQEIGAGLDRRSQDGSIFGGKRETCRRLKGGSIRYQVSLLQQGFEPYLMVFSHTVSADFIRYVKRSHADDARFSPELQKWVAGAIRGGENDIRVKKDAE